jgi:glycosyltransferase involved in cell wall biosynthesis
MPEDSLFLSIVIPALNEEERLPGTLEQVFHFLSQQDYLAEVLVVENGSSDRTLDVAREFARGHPSLRPLHEPLRGKGRAVRRGMLEARGAYRFICDADLSMPINELRRFIPPELQGVDIAIGSREAPGAVRYNEPWNRHLSGRVFNWLIHMLVLPGLKDTQCGFKCFSAAAAEDIFPRLTLMGWSFDVEALFIARRAGYRIVEIPIDWYFNSQSKVSLLRDSMRMAGDLLAIRRNARLGLYDGKPN